MRSAKSEQSLYRPSLERSRTRGGVLWCIGHALALRGRPNGGNPPRIGGSLVHSHQFLDRFLVQGMIWIEVTTVVGATIAGRWKSQAQIPLYGLRVLYETCHLATLLSRYRQQGRQSHPHKSWRPWRPSTRSPVAVPGEGQGRCQRTHEGKDEHDAEGDRVCGGCVAGKEPCKQCDHDRGGEEPERQEAQEC